MVSNGDMKNKSLSPGRHTWAPEGGWMNGAPGESHPDCETEINSMPTDGTQSRA